MRDGAHLYSIEQNADNVQLARSNIAHAGLQDRVTILHGTVDMWKSTLQQLAFDFVFLDHQKSVYLTELLRLEAWGIVRNGVLVAADNVAGLKHMQGRQKSIQRGKRKK